MSNRVNVRSEVQVYERDGVSVLAQEHAGRIAIESHGIREGFAVITIPGLAHTITVLRSDLIVALENAGRTNG